MRLTGWVLLAIGGLLCATISWAALGFLLMGIGLISLQVAERRRRPAAVPAGASRFTPPRLSAGLQPPTLDEIVGQDTGPKRQARRVAWPDKTADAPYDQETWRRLVESDPDLAQLASVLADYGPQYVDELAASYLAAPDKGRLGAIVDGIIARARGGQPVPPPAPPEASRPLPPPPEPQVSTPTARPDAPPPVPPATPAGALEASLFAAVEEASAKLTAERTDLAKAAEGRSLTPSRREPLFGRAPRDAKPVGPPPEIPADLEASLIAAVSEAAARRADAPMPTPEQAPIVAKPEPETGAVAPDPAQPAPVKTPAAKASADDLDESLLAALAEISGQKFKDEPKPDAASKGPPADDGLSDMIKKFAPDSNFLRKT
ncbi:hypothetical protein ABIB82_004416 [Bradyrhizobium sp. i1.8.4]|uniref:hypothetical protein n=1 Tax=unclassified Bradyrhizobium TaxID=2631580 RepID=UPI003D1A3C7E